MAEPGPLETQPPSEPDAAAAAPSVPPAGMAAVSEPQLAAADSDAAASAVVEEAAAALPDPLPSLAPAPAPAPLPRKASMAHVEAQTIMHHLSFSEILRLGRCNRFLCRSASSPFAFKHAPFVLSSLLQPLPSEQQMGGRIVRHAPLELQWRYAPESLVANKDITPMGMRAISDHAPVEQGRRFRQALEQVHAAATASGRALWGLASQTAAPVQFEIWSVMLQRPEIVGIRSLRMEAATATDLQRCPLAPPLLHVALESLPCLTRLSVTHRQERAVLDLVQSWALGSSSSSCSPCSSDVTVACVLSLSHASLSTSVFKQLTTHPRMHSLQQLRLKAVDTGLQCNAALWAPAFAGLPRLTALQLDQGSLLSRSLSIFPHALSLRDLAVVVRAYSASFAQLDVSAVAAVLRSLPQLHCRVHPILATPASAAEFCQAVKGMELLEQFGERCCVLQSETRF